MSQANVESSTLFAVIYSYQFRIEKKAEAKLARTVWQLARKPAQAAGPYQALNMASLRYFWLSWVAQPSRAELRQHYDGRINRNGTVPYSNHANHYVLQQLMQHLYLPPEPSMTTSVLIVTNNGQVSTQYIISTVLPASLQTSPAQITSWTGKNVAGIMGGLFGKLIFWFSNWRPVETFLFSMVLFSIPNAMSFRQ